MVAVLALLAGCSRNESKILYCNPADQSSSWRDGAMHIDLERRLIYGDDTSSAIDPFVQGDFAGFESEFPILLPSASVIPEQLGQDILVGEVLFHVHPVEGSSGDLWLITARPQKAESAQAALQKSAVLYSRTDGVLSMGFSAVIGEKVYPVNFVPCSKRTLRHEDVRRIAAAGGLTAPP
jgi:hypothetical protein